MYIYTFVHIHLNRKIDNLCMYLSIIKIPFVNIKYTQTYNKPGSHGNDVDVHQLSNS